MHTFIFLSEFFVGRYWAFLLYPQTVVITLLELQTFWGDVAVQ